MSGYRDDADALRARIAQLEDEVADLRAQIRRSPAAQARVAELEGRRARAKAELSATARWIRSALIAIGAIGFVGSVVFVGAIASMGSRGHPLNAAILCVVILAPLIGLVAAIGDVQRTSRTRALVSIERELAEARKGPLPPPIAEPMRIADEVAEPLEEESAESEKKRTRA